MLRPAETLAAEMYPGCRSSRRCPPGASDLVFLSAAGIPSYGVPGILYESPDGGGIHGLNEHIRVSSAQGLRQYLYRLIKLYASA